MKFFIDTAEVKDIKKYYDIGIVDGVTTNPSLIMKSGRNFEEVCKEILAIVDGPVSVEAVSENAEGMVREAESFAKWGKNVVVKIPMTPEGIKAAKQLSKKGIKTNVTLVFSSAQALLAAKAGATYVSPFIGRLDDIAQEGMELIHEIVSMYDNYDFKTQILVASIRSPLHVVQAAMLGADVATIPPDVMDKLFKHPLTDAGLKKFMEDWKSAKK
jgi:transaldolase